MGFKLVAEDFADFGEAGFYFAADGGSHFAVSSGVFHVHEVSLQSNTALGTSGAKALYKNA
jgi:hypothetical protein